MLRSFPPLDPSPPGEKPVSGPGAPAPARGGRSASSQHPPPHPAGVRGQQTGRRDREDRADATLPAAGSPPSRASLTRDCACLQLSRWAPGLRGLGLCSTPPLAPPRECPAPATPPEAAGATAPGRGGAPAARLAPHTPRGRVPGAPPSAAPTPGEQPAPSQLRPISPATSLVPLGVPRASPGGPLEPSRVTVTLLQCSFLFEALRGTVCTCSPMMGQLRDMRDP